MLWKLQGYLLYKISIQTMMEWFEYFRSGFPYRTLSFWFVWGLNKKRHQNRHLFGSDFWGTSRSPWKINHFFNRFSLSILRICINTCKIYLVISTNPKNLYQINSVPTAFQKAPFYFYTKSKHGLRVEIWNPILSIGNLWITWEHCLCEKKIRAKYIN